MMTSGHELANIADQAREGHVLNIVQAVELVQGRTDIPLTPCHSRLLRAKWQRALGTPGAVASGTGQPMSGDAVIAGYQTTEPSSFSTAVIQIDLHDNRNAALLYVPVKDGHVDVVSIRALKYIEQYGVVAASILALHGIQPPATSEAN